MPLEPRTRIDRKVRRTAQACLQASAAVAGADPDRPAGARLLVVLTDVVQSFDDSGRSCSEQAGTLSLTQLMDAGEAGRAELSAIADRAFAGAGDRDLGPQLAVVHQRLAQILDAPVPDQVQALAGPVDTSTLLEAAAIEICAIGLGAGIQMPRTSLIAASRGLAGVLGDRFGGRTIEMRVPPATAVQLEAFGQGPSHHRGTPPNVAETDPATFVRLATGLATWQQVREAGLIQASGSHVDAMARMLPVIDLG